jgi:hypothetical protein
MTQSTSTATPAPTLTFAIDRVPIVEEGIPISRSESVKLEISSIDVVTPEQMKVVLRDAELMTGLLRDKPDDMRSLLNDVVAGRTDAAKETARRIGLSEADFKGQGGGMWPWIAVVGIVILACAAFGCPSEGEG